MKNIKLYATIIKYISYAFIPLCVIRQYLIWFSDTISYVDQQTLQVKVAYMFGTPVSGEQLSNITSMPLVNRLLGLSIDSIACGLFLSALLTIVALMRRLEQGERFSLELAELFSKLSKQMFLWTAYLPINYMLLSLITSLHKPSGQRVISLAIGSHDLVNIIIFSFLMIISSLMVQAYQLQNEHDLTV